MQDESPLIVSAATSVPAPRLALHPVLATKVNFATAQNGVAVVKQLGIENTGTEAVRDIRLTLTASPAMLREKTWVIDQIAPGTTLQLSDLETVLDPVLLGGLDEAEIGQLHFRLSAQGMDDIASTHGIEMLARDEWGGLIEMDNILAAFVSPNQPAVARILKEAARLLEAAGHSGAMDGYQGADPHRVWMVAGAIWSAATGLGLTYAVPPASFERVGQKIRDPERIASEGLATCLDSTLLVAAACEAAGLNTAVLFSHGHAWVGLWLVRKDFGRLVEPDVVAVRKATAAREFVPLETTLLTRRPAAGFEEANAAGRDRLSEAHEAEFVQAVDINRARAARIRPLASHRTPDAAASGDIAASPAALPRPLDLGLLPGELVEEVPTTPLGRVERWQRKLLDLSLANRLLNFRDTAGAVPMICPDISSTEDRLAGGDVFRLLALKDENAVSGRDIPAEEARQIERGLALDALTRGQLAVPLTVRDMTTRLTELYRKTRSDMAEGGTNTLFLAIGFLRWKRTEGDTRSYRAPLLLLPVKLERRSAQSEYRLTQLEDEVRFNATLLEMLKRDFELRIADLEGELPRDESGLDIPRIMEIVRQRVRDVAGFEVVEDCALSTFSFAKYLMWKDLVDRTDSLRESRLVAHLLDNPTETFEGARTPMPHPSDIDRKQAPGDLLAPLPADSSQLAAVLAAAQGRDFVLIGPPGTGKSQTITNIIADQLGRGRTVLFVAEKSAALDVVYRRLERHGLGNAVLELHSSKADRKSVLTQLGRSWDRASSAARAQEWVRVAEDLRLTRDQLNAYVDALHRPGTQGFSVYQAIGQVAAGSPGFALRFDNKDCHDEASWRRLRTLAADLGARWRIVADLDAAGPLSLLDHAEWSYGWQDRYLDCARALRLARMAVRDARAALAQRLGVGPADCEQPDIAAALVWLAAQRLDKPAVAAEALRDPDGARAGFDALKDALSRAALARSALSARYADEGLADMPLDALELQWREAKGKSWPFAGMAQKKVTKLLQSYAGAGQADPERDLPALKQLLRARQDIAASGLRSLPGFADEQTDAARIIAEIDAAAAFLKVEQHLRSAGLPATRLEEQRPQLSRAAGGDLAPLLQAVRDTDARVVQAAAAFTDAGGTLSQDDALLAGLEALQGRFGDWLKWRACRAEAIGAGMEPLVRALEEKADIPDTARAFAQAYMAWWLRLAMDAEPCLRGFAHWEHDALIRRFRELDDALANLASDEVMRRLGNDLPARDSVPRSSELGVLRHQLGLQRPTRAIRSLIAEMPTTFGKLAPCVLMSPLSVAQYLPAGQAQFDLVIFDEASQISTWDAIGAIARGRQAIIVGDPKQLPPTNFFGRSDSDEGAELDEIEKDMPSILDEVAAAGIPTHRLNWHYRSRDEALIAFSNHHYYDGGLVTFPSPDASGNAVRLHKVKGVYGRGTGSTNPDEARAITGFIRKRLTDWLKLPEDKRPTLGVITFNAQQQGLILDLLDAERKANPDLEWFFADDREEPVIVKNLENIQGDERDVMLFSITFGHDQAGKLTMNFGAMNKDGGEKRLNVAVTRARAELHVFASITADQIDTGRTRARGVADLKAFLDFADRGPVALAAQDSGSVGPAESPFEEAVRDALAAKGWEVHPQIGVSGFRIDLGVRHPGHAGAWLAGVECDGARYHASATARDRDRIRQAVLEGLGWKILRIWSTDWFRSPHATITRIDAALQTLLSADRARRADEDAQRDAAEDVAPVAEEPVILPIPEPGPQHTEVAPSDAVIEEPVVRFADNAAGATAPVAPVQAVQPNPQRFFDEDYSADLRGLMQQIVAQEGPMPDASLARRISQLHGWQRTGTRIQARLAKLHDAFDVRPEGDVAFLWPAGGVKDRVAYRGMGDRALRDISRAEIASVIDLNEAVISDAEDPDLALARLLGIGRLSRDARDYLQLCRDWRKTA